MQKTNQPEPSGITLEVEGEETTLEKFIEDNTGDDVGGLSEEEILQVKSLAIDEEISIGHVAIKRIKSLGNVFCLQTPGSYEMTSKMEAVRFRVLSLDDFRSHGSELVVGGEFDGEIDSSGKRVYYKDKTSDEWVFYVGDTCELLANS